MSLQERTLVVKNFDPEKTTSKLLKELCIQGGPVRNVVMRPDHAFVEYEDVESVGYSKALLDGIELFGKDLILEPKLRNASYRRYTNILQEYIKNDKHKREVERQQQERVMFYNQQAQLAAQYPFHVSQNLQPPIYYQNSTPLIPPQNNVFAPQPQQFVNPVQTSTPMQTFSRNPSSRSSSNHHHHSKNRNRPPRNSDKRWR